jgi:hypothetical protein
VAILKVDATNMATVQLGDDTALSAGDRLFVLGFPGPATFSPVLSKESEKEPTLTQGVLSAKKTASEGFPVLQTDAAMTHGNSGGPVFDEQGRVVGVATFGSVDPRTGREVAGLNFAVPVSVVNELLARAKVEPVEGAATESYRLGLDAFEKHWYKRALPLFKEVKRLDPAHPLVDKLINDSQNGIAQGRDRTPREILGLPLAYFAALAAVALVAVVVVVTALARRRRRRRQRPGAAVPDPSWAPPAPGWPPGPGTATYPGAAPPGAAPPAPPGVQVDAFGRRVAVEQSDWWSATAAGPPENQTAELPVVSGAAPRPATEVPPRPRHDWWQRDWATDQPAAPVEKPAGVAGHPAERPTRPGSRPAEPLVCSSCGYACPPTNRFCEHCWSVLGS